MPTQTFTVTRPKKDGGPAVLILHVLGRALRMERGTSVDLPVDPDKQASILADLESRYTVAAKEEQPDKAPPAQRRRRQPEPDPSTTPEPEKES